MPEYAVVDLETTGIHPGWNHRVVEIAITWVDDAGTVGESWETLVNPMRDLGAQDIHGISGSDVRLAPAFSDILGEVVHRLRGRTIVAHNASFDLRFLEAEIGRAGWTVDHLDESTVCTMALADHYMGRGLRSLSACCNALDVPYEDAHRASADARATAELLSLFLQAEPTASWWSDAAAFAARVTWPDLSHGLVSPLVRGAALSGASDLVSLVERIEANVAPPYSLKYFALLDRILDDGRVSVPERREVESFAREFGIADHEFIDLNCSYMASVVRACTEDQVLTADEKAKIIQYSTLLDISERDLHSLLALAERESWEVDPTVPLRVGDRVVFTGMAESRKEELRDFAEDSGLVVQPRVTKGTRVVVALDIATGSGKASKAREYGKPVISESSFEQSLRRIKRSQ